MVGLAANVLGELWSGGGSPVCVTVVDGVVVISEVAGVLLSTIDQE